MLRTEFARNNYCTVSDSRSSSSTVARRGHSWFAVPVLQCIRAPAAARASCAGRGPVTGRPTMQVDAANATLYSASTFAVLRYEFKLAIGRCAGCAATGSSFLIRARRSRCLSRFVPRCYAAACTFASKHEQKQHYFWYCKKCSQESNKTQKFDAFVRSLCALSSRFAPTQANYSKFEFISSSQFVFAALPPLLSSAARASGFASALRQQSLRAPPAPCLARNWPLSFCLSACPLSVRAAD